MIELESITFNYTGTIQSIYISPGIYQLELWGASGGSDSAGYGYGGYIKGLFICLIYRNIYICVGGVGASSTTGSGGGYNGGGNAGNSGTSGAGGGATHISLKSGVLSSLENDKDKILIVAGGGGGGGNGSWPALSQSYGGYPNGGPNNANQIATQDSGYSFGKGGNKSGDGGGGGGGWYGGYPSTADASGGGGSSYANPLLEQIKFINGGNSAKTHGKAIITCMRIFDDGDMFMKNSNLYKDSIPQVQSDFEQILGGI